MLTDEQIAKIESYAGWGRDHSQWSAGATCEETIALCADHRALTARVAELEREFERALKDRNEYRDALIDIHNCWMVELADAKPETRAAIDKALGA